MSPTVPAHTDPAARPRTAVAVPAGATAVLVTMWHSGGGPWTMLADEPDTARDMAGPPPGFIALAGIASCTLVTVAGVASRRGPPVDDMRLTFTVLEVAGGIDVHERLTVDAPLPDADRLRFVRAAGHCPVGKLFMQRALHLEDVIHLRGASSNAPPPATLDGPVVPAFLPGSVVARWHGDTREWSEVDGARVVEQEGEVTMHLDLGRGRRFGLVGGHTSAHWGPQPSAYAKAALASSALMTLRAQADQLGIDPESLRVEVRAVTPPPEGGKRVSQQWAEEGKTVHVQWVREVSADASAGSASVAGIARALRRDPLGIHVERGDLVHEHEVVGNAGAAAS